jgi:hypothetical protein
MPEIDPIRAFPALPRPPQVRAAFVPLLVIWSLPVQPDMHCGLFVFGSLYQTGIFKPAVEQVIIFQAYQVSKVLMNIQMFLRIYQKRFRISIKKRRDVSIFRYNGLGKDFAYNIVDAICCLN